MKAYNSVRWDFLLAILRTIGFPSHMVNWIGECDEDQPNIKHNHANDPLKVPNGPITRARAN